MPFHTKMDKDDLKKNKGLMTSAEVANDFRGEANYFNKDYGNKHREVMNR